MHMARNWAEEKMKASILLTVYLLKQKHMARNWAEEKMKASILLTVYLLKQNGPSFE